MEMLLIECDVGSQSTNQRICSSVASNSVYSSSPRSTDIFLYRLHYVDLNACVCVCVCVCVCIIVNRNRNIFKHNVIMDCPLFKAFFLFVF